MASLVFIYCSTHCDNTAFACHQCVCACVCVHEGMHACMHVHKMMGIPDLLVRKRMKTQNTIIFQMGSFHLLHFLRKRQQCTKNVSVR